MSDEKWKSPTGHPISSSETDKAKPCPEGLECSGDGSDCVGEYRCVKEPDAVSVEALHRLASLEPNGFFRKGWLTAIDHLRARHPNGVKWED